MNSTLQTTPEAASESGQKSDPLAWLCGEDARHYFRLTHFDLRQKRLDGSISTKPLNSRMVLYSRAELEAATGRRPSIRWLSGIGAVLYCERAHGCQVTSARLSVAQRAGSVETEQNAKAKHRRYKVADLNRLCSAPWYDEGKYEHGGERYVTALRSERLYGLSTGNQAAWRKECPLLGRRLTAMQVLMRHRDGEYTSLRWTWVYLEKEQAQIAELREAAKDTRRTREVERTTGANGREEGPETLLSYEEIEQRYGWSVKLLRYYDKHGWALLRGRRLKPRLKVRDTGFGVRKVRAIPKLVCDEAKANEQGFIAEAAGYTPVAEVARRLTLPETTVMSWTEHDCPFTGKRLASRKLYARDSSGHWRKQWHLPTGEVETIRSKMEAADKPIEGEITIREAAATSGLPLWLLYLLPGKDRRPPEPNRTMRHMVKYVRRADVEELARKRSNGTATQAGPVTPPADRQTDPTGIPAADRQTDATGEKRDAGKQPPPSYPDPDNEERDRWLTEARQANWTLRQIRDALEREHGQKWNGLNSDNGVRKAIRQYCTHYGLAYPEGAPGRPKTPA